MMMLTLKNKQRGMTIVELIVAVSISTVAMISLVILVMMCQRSMREGFTENRLRAEGSLFLEKVKKELTFSYRHDAVDATNRPTISSSSDSITFFTPDTTGDDAEESFNLALDSGDSSKLVLTRNGSEFETLSNVSRFHVDSQEGLLTLMITIDRDLNMGSRSAHKQFTLVGRALPRNMGEISIEDGDDGTI